MLIWQPGNYWSAQQVTCDGMIQYNPAITGEYLVKIVSTAPSTTYAVTGSRNGAFGARLSASEVSIVVLARPDVVAPISELELVQIDVGVDICTNGVILEGAVPVAAVENCIVSAVQLTTQTTHTMPDAALWVGLLLLLITLRHVASRTR